MTELVDELVRFGAKRSERRDLAAVPRHRNVPFLFHNDAGGVVYVWSRFGVVSICFGWYDDVARYNVTYQRFKTTTSTRWSGLSLGDTLRLLVRVLSNPLHSAVRDVCCNKENSGAAASCRRH